MVIRGQRVLLAAGILMLAWGGFRISQSVELARDGTRTEGVVSWASRRNVLVQVRENGRPRTIRVRRPWWKLIVRRNTTADVLYDPLGDYNTIAFGPRGSFADPASLWLAPFCWIAGGLVLVYLYWLGHRPGFHTSMSIGSDPE